MKCPPKKQITQLNLADEEIGTNDDVPEIESGGSLPSEVAVNLNVKNSIPDIARPL